MISKCNFITQTIIPEVYRVYDANKKGVIGSPTTICKGSPGSLFVADVNGIIYRARLHYPVDVIELDKGFDTPLGLVFHDGLLFLSEKGKGTMRILT